MNRPDLPDVGDTGTVLYSDWRNGVLSREEADRQRAKADRGHALAITPHPDATDDQDAYTEVVSCADQRTGRPLHGVRTVTPSGEELVRYPSAREAWERYDRAVLARR